MSPRECPKCGGQTRVTHTTDDREQGKTIRRRQCKRPECGHRFTTAESQARRMWGDA